jgi:hypothetical protein
MIGVAAMKNPKTISSTGQGDCSLTFSHFIRTGVSLTLVYLVALPSAGLLIAAVDGPASLLIPSLHFDFMILCRIIAFFTVLLVFATWVGTIVAGCLVMVPVWISRFGNSLAKTRTKGTMPRGQFWDQWMDGPEPL